MWEKELKTAIEVIHKAREVVLNVYNSLDYDVQIKDDDSPVTKADMLSDALITSLLKEAFPTHAFLTEESVDDKKRLSNDYVWIIDPVDGTKDFIARNGEFTINIALAYKHEVVVGVIDIPCTETTYYMSKGNGSFILKDGVSTRIHVNDKKNNLIVLTSRYHKNGEEYEIINKHKDRITKIDTVGSSIKGCYIAQGKAEISYRKSPYTKEWDTAAMQGILEEAGGYLLGYDGIPLKYNREDVYNRNGYILINNKDNFLI